jgi:hypothetical protein
MVATLQFGAGGQARPMASGKRRWSASEDEALGQWVAGCGARWTALEADGLLPARTARAMESRWKELRRKGGTAGLTQDGGGSEVSQSLPSQGVLRPAGMADSTEGWVAEGWGQAAPAAAETVRGPRMGVLRFEEDAATATGNARRRAHGRAWTSALKALGPAAREAAPHEKKKAAAWGIDGVGPARATVFPRAVQMLRRGAGVSKVSVGSRGKLSTLMATRTRVPYVSGGVAGGGRPMQAKEAAALLGISLRSEAWREAASGLSEEEQRRATADSVDAHHVRAMWRNAAEMAEARGRTLEGRELRYAGMFAGALDAIFTGGRAQGWPLRYVAVAEENRLRRGCLSKAYLTNKCSLASNSSSRAALRLKESESPWRLRPCFVLACACQGLRPPRLWPLPRLRPRGLWCLGSRSERTASVDSSSAAAGLLYRPNQYAASRSRSAAVAERHDFMASRASRRAVSALGREPADLKVKVARRRRRRRRHPCADVPCRARVRLTSRSPADWTLRWATTWARSSR